MLPVVFGFILLLYGLHSLTKGKAQYPPGPMCLPILGCVHLLPQEYQEKAFMEWGKKYGSFSSRVMSFRWLSHWISGGIIFAKLFRKPAVIINSYDIARDLLERRSSNYSDRPRFILFMELYVWIRSRRGLNANSWPRLTT